MNQIICPYIKASRFWGYGFLIWFFNLGYIYFPADIRPILCVRNIKCTIFLVFALVKRFLHQNSSSICVELCTPMYGRYVKDVPDRFIIRNILNVLTWEECGNLCHEHQDCLMWTWNVPLNSGIRNLCVLLASDQYETEPNPDWISGKNNCYKSIGSSSPIGP